MSDPQLAPAKPEPLIQLRGIVDFSKQYQVFVGECLQTGHIVTADDSATACSMLEEILTDEIVHAINHGSLTHLFSNASSLEVWQRWRTVPYRRIQLKFLPNEIDTLRLEPIAELLLAEGKHD